MRGRRGCTGRELLGVVSAAPLAGIAACRREPVGEPPIAIPIAELPEGERVIVMRGEEPVELVRTGDAVRARPLWCTHTGCRVNWVEAHGFYLCACHEGLFDADGRVMRGPPPAPLREVAWTREGDRILLPPGGPSMVPPAAPAKRAPTA